MKQDPRNSDIPEEYKKGETRFLNCRIDLSRRPLIPRPETEFWTRRAIIDLAKLKGNIHVLDIFSGSGCVGVAVAKNLPEALVDFADIDRAPAEQIKINLEANNIAQNRVRVFKSDIFNNIPKFSYDAILANPPYIDPARVGLVQKSVLDWEPHRALFAPKSGMEAIEKFLRHAKDFLKERGIIYMEFDSLQKKQITAIVKKERYSSFEFSKDQFGKWRFAKIIK